MRNTHFPGRSVVMSTSAMAASSQPVATQAALQILREGGNALDAAIAAAAVLAVVEPMSTGIGGDCFLLYHEASSGRLHALNGSGWAPAAATPHEIRARMQQDARANTNVNDGGLTRGSAGGVQSGMLSVTVPGAIDAWCTAHERFGRAEFATLLSPAIGYAQDGFAVTPVIASHWAETVDTLRGHPATARCYLIDDSAPSAGSIHRQPELADSLKRIARNGREAFYSGEIAERIVAFSDAHGGLLSLDDLAEFRSEWVDPISTRYRDHDVFEIPPNGQGLTVLLALNTLAQMDVGALQHLSAEHVHTISEAFALSVAERDKFVADQRFAEVPVQGLLSSEFAQSQFARIDPDRAASERPVSAFPAHDDTVYLTVVDKDRNACSFINSLFSSWGSGLVVDGTGICLHNRGASFSLEPEHFNCIAPHKRPLHTIIPAMVYRDDKPVMSFGVMGGHYQAMGHCYFLSNWLDHGMDIQEALDAPRFLLYDGELALEQCVPFATAERLRAMGHTVVPAASSMGGGQAIYIDERNGTLHGASEPRKDGCAMGF